MINRFDSSETLIPLKKFQPLGAGIRCPGGNSRSSPCQAASSLHYLREGDRMRLGTHKQGFQGQVCSTLGRQAFLHTEQLLREKLLVVTCPGQNANSSLVWEVSNYHPRVVEALRSVMFWKQESNETRPIKIYTWALLRVCPKVECAGKTRPHYTAIQYGCINLNACFLTR